MPHVSTKAVPYLVNFGLLAVAITASTVFKKLHTINPDASYIIDFLSCVVTSNVAMLQFFWDQSVERFQKSKSNQIAAMIDDLQGSPLAADAYQAEEYALKKITEIHSGKLTLNKLEFFLHLNKKLNSARNGSRIRTVSLAETLCSSDDSQVNHQQALLQAAKNGADIRRIVVVNIDDAGIVENMRARLKTLAHQNITVDFYRLENPPPERFVHFLEEDLTAIEGALSKDSYGHIRYKTYETKPYSEIFDALLEGKIQDAAPLLSTNEPRPQTRPTPSEQLLK